jgi:hypothetical protein
MLTAMGLALGCGPSATTISIFPALIVLTLDLATLAWFYLTLLRDMSIPFDVSELMEIMLVNFEHGCRCDMGSICHSCRVNYLPCHLLRCADLKAGQFEDLSCPGVHEDTRHNL